MLTYSNNFNHFTSFNSSIAIDVVHLISPLQFFFRSSTGGNVNSEKEFFKVNFARVIFVKSPEYMGAELLCVSIREEARVNFDEFLFA